MTTDMSTASLRSLQEGISRRGRGNLMMMPGWAAEGGEAPKKAESLGGGVRRAES